MRRHRQNAVGTRKCNEKRIKIFEQTIFCRQLENDYLYICDMTRRHDCCPVSMPVTFHGCIDTCNCKRRRRRRRHMAAHYVVLRLAGRRIITTNNTKTTMCCQKYKLLQANTAFFTACGKASFVSTVYATAHLSVRPSVCLSHSGIVSKRRKAEGCGLHCRVAHSL